MKSKFIKPGLIAGLFLAGICFLSACSKSDTNSNITASSFSWTVGGTTYTADNDTAFVSGPFTIIAKKDETSPTNFKIFEINLTGFTTGAYTLTATGANQVNYLTNSGLVTSQSGTLNITANTGTALSGNFTTTLTGSLAMTGTFTNMPVKP